MALGVDTWAAETVLKEKAISPQIRLVAAVPFAVQGSRWYPAQRTRWASILGRADQIYCTGQVVSYQTILALAQGPAQDDAGYLLNERNRFMVDMSDGVIAVWDGTTGGTGNCVAYARKMGKPICRIDPKTQKIATIR